MEPFLVWDFGEAPQELKDVSDNGGDEDWIAEIPPSWADKWIPWIDGGDFGCCDVSYYDHPLKPGYKIAIGCHA